MAGKQTIVINTEPDWLVYDILNETYLRGRTIQNDQNYKEVASMFASEDEENYEKICRSIKKGFAEIKCELSEYLDLNATTTDNTSYDLSEDSLTLALRMPSNFNLSTIDNIAESIHDYLKNLAISEWYLVTNKGDAENYMLLAGKSIDNLRKSVSKRRRPSSPRANNG